MKSYIGKSDRLLFCGGWLHCLNWGMEQVKADKSAVIKIHVARAGEKTGRVVAEITNDGIRLIRNGRYVPLSGFREVIRGKS